MNPDIFAGFHIFPAVFYRIVVTIQNKTGGISMKHIVLTGGGTAGHGRQTAKKYPGIICRF